MAASGNKSPRGPRPSPLGPVCQNQGVEKYAVVVHEEAEGRVLG
jgi:hypothetical protein